MVVGAMVMACLRDGSDDLPVVSGHPRGSNGNPGMLTPALSVDICATFFSVCSTRQDYVSHWRSNISVVTWGGRWVKLNW